MNILEAAKRINDDDAMADKVGAKLAAIFYLKKDERHPDRWKTDWGTKSNIGLARTMLRAIESSIED